MPMEAMSDTQQAERAAMRPAQARRAEADAIRRQPLATLVDALGVGAGLAMLGAFLFLPWLRIQGEGVTALSLLTDAPAQVAGRISAPALVPVAAVLAAAFSAVALVAPRLSRLGAYAVLVSGLVGGVYFITFFVENSGVNTITYMAGAGFWVAFFATGFLVVQIGAPRHGLSLPALMGIGAEETTEHVYLGVFAGQSALVLERMAWWLGSQPRYLAVFAWLAILTLIEVSLAASEFPLTPLVLVVLSAVKVLLVVAYYMHLKSDSRLFRYVMLIPAPFVALILLGLLVGL
ncbi:MAG: hypothetical protein Kow00120_06910 [Anaerolineae bacterium]